MSTYMKAGQPWLYDSDTGDIVGVKDRDGGETFFGRYARDSSGNVTGLVGADGAVMPIWVPFAHEKVGGSGIQSFTLTGLARFKKIRIHLNIGTALSSALAVQFNGDTGANYGYSLLSYYGQSVLASAFATSHAEGQTAMNLGPAYASILASHTLEFWNHTGGPHSIQCLNREITTVPQYENHTGNGYWTGTDLISSIKIFNALPFDWSTDTELFAEGLVTPT